MMRKSSPFDELCADLCNVAVIRHGTCFLCWDAATSREAFLIIVCKFKDVTKLFRLL